MNYWVGGAMFGGNDDQYDDFLKRGYWYCWGPGSDAPAAVQKLFPQIKEGDRIAIKKMLGAGAAGQIEIRAIGVVKAVDLAEWRVYVDWFPHFVNRHVPFHGLGGSLHGPFTADQDTADDDWVRRAFCI